jgi:hypothetical protein
VNRFLSFQAVFAVLVFSLPASARANIGDTMTELRQRYGSAKDMSGQMLFEVRLKDGQFVPARGATDTENHFTITVYFDGDHSGMEVITRNTSDPVKAAISQDDLKQLLDATSNGMTWVPFAAKDGKPTWLRRDSKENPQRLLARFDASQSDKADDAAVLVVMLYTEK